MGGHLLHVGCGGCPLPDWFEDYTEVRLDIDESVNPDIVASMTRLGEIGTYDALYCNHALEHLTFNDVGKALKEFRRVLNEGGFAMVIVPDLEDVKPTDEVILNAPIGPITGLDMIYGLRSSDNPHMAHRMGFVCESLDNAMREAGFSKVKTSRLENYNLMSVGVK